MVYSNLAPSTLFLLTEFFCFLAGATGALLQTGVFGLAANFPPVYTQVPQSETLPLPPLHEKRKRRAKESHSHVEISTFELAIAQAVMSGQGLAGIGATLSALATTATEGHEDNPDGTVKPKTLEEVQPAAFAYFMVSVGILIAGVIGFTVLSFLPYARHHASKSSRFKRTLNENSKDNLYDETSEDASPSSPGPDIELPEIKAKWSHREPGSPRSRVLYSVLHSVPKAYYGRHTKEPEEGVTNWLMDPSAQDADDDLRDAHPSQTPDMAGLSSSAKEGGAVIVSGQ